MHGHRQSAAGRQTTSDVSLDEIAPACLHVSSRVLRFHPLGPVPTHQHDARRSLRRAVKSSRAREWRFNASAGPSVERGLPRVPRRPCGAS